MIAQVDTAYDDTRPTRVLRWDFRFLVLDDARWIAFEPALGCAFRVNRRARDLIESLSGNVSLSGAFGRFAERQPTSDLPRFMADVCHLERLVEASRGRSRRRLTLSATLVPYHLFSLWSGAFRGLITRPVLLLNLLGLLLVLIAATAGLLPDTVSHGRLANAVGGGLVIASVFVHELGHGAALRRFGHVTGPMGIGLYFIYPVFYVEMMTLEALPKCGRLWVDIGGSHLQVLFGHGLLCLGYALGVPWLVTLALAIYSLAAFQLLPINRSDGYWLLLDMIEGVVDSKHVRWIRCGCHVLAGTFFTAVVAASLKHLWLELSYGHVTWRSIDVDGFIGMAQIAVLLVLLSKFVLRRRRREMGDLATPRYRDSNGDARDGTCR